MDEPRTAAGRAHVEALFRRGHYGLREANRSIARIEREAAEAARPEVADPRLDLGPRCRGESPDGACDDETCEAHGAATAGREPLNALRVRSLVARLTNALGRYADFRDHGALATAAMEWDEIEVLAERVLRAALDTPDPAETNRG